MDNYVHGKYRLMWFCEVEIVYRKEVKTDLSDDYDYHITT